MSKISFDNRGYVQAKNGVLKLNIAELEEYFVKQFEDNDHRKKLFQSYCEYSTDLQKIIQKPIKQWIDGSFTSTKLDPKDIDIVSFIDFYDTARNEIHTQFNKRQIAQKYQNIDAYLVGQYNPNDKLYPIFEIDKTYWADLFGHTRFNHRKQRFSKAFIQIIFG